jgi:hypothetical protein
MIESTTTVFTCEACEREFLSKTSCTRHERQCVKRKAAEEERVRKREEISNHIRLTCDDIHQLAGMIEEHVKVHCGGEVRLTLSAASIRHDYDDKDKPVISMTAEGQWIKLLKRDNHYGEASFSDLFGWSRYNNIPAIAGIETGSGGGRGNNKFSYNLRVALDKFPLLEAKRNFLNALEAGRKRYLAESQRLAGVHKGLVENLARVDADRIELNQELLKVQDILETARVREQQLIKALEYNFTKISRESFEENKDILTPGKEFQYDEESYNNCKRSLQL